MTLFTGLMPASRRQFYPMPPARLGLLRMDPGLHLGAPAMDRAIIMTEAEYKVVIVQHGLLIHCSVRGLSGARIACEWAANPDDAVQLAYINWFMRHDGLP